MTDRADPDVVPDTKDWTWVLGRPCPDCGYDAGAVRPVDVAAHLRRDADDWTTRLAAATARTRPAPGVWSVLEYGCHVRDVHRIFAGRVRSMLEEDEPRFPNWDQDQAALDEHYGAQDPASVAEDLRQAAAVVADLYDTVPADGWSRRGLRSNGSEFTIASLSTYHLHDIAHHAWDVTGPTT